MKNLILFSLMSIVVSLTAQNQIIKDYTAVQCDSLINANVDNPNFVILDVRTANEYIPQHLEGAIMRDFYDTDFKDQLDLLNKEKVYVMHCRSGGRSGSTLKTMKSLGFKEVYNMLGGIIAWNRNAFPTTKEFAPRNMLVSDQDQFMSNVAIGTTKTIKITLTNRANDKLILSALSSTMGPEFSTDFVMGTVLEGSVDYSFIVTYNPSNIGTDYISYTVESNGGNIPFNIEATGIMSTATSSEELNNIHVYPNPVVSDILLVEGLTDNIVSLSLVNSIGLVVVEQRVNNSKIVMDVTDVRDGFYSLCIYSNEGLQVVRKVVRQSSP